ncbi:MAG: molybdenum cofactor biosynthesis protein MoaE [Mycobacterium sp.]|nr:molybdenum cofactor biosynthesis protein MoaE [Mycobacterium sp.]
MTRILRAQVGEDAISLGEHEALVGDAAAGAVVVFAGVVRDHDNGRSVLRLEYSAHPSAQQTLFEVLAEVAAATVGVRAIAASHRIGQLTIGDAALVVAVAADHRAAAFQTCAALVDSIKERLPVWKRQFFADGTDEWVNCA